MNPHPKLLTGSRSWYGSGKDHSGPGSGQLQIRNEFEVKIIWKTDKIWPFPNKNVQFKNTNFPFYKKFPKKLIFCHNMQPDTLSSREYTGKIYVKNIRKIHVGSEANWKIGSGSAKIIPVHNTVTKGWVHAKYIPCSWRWQSALSSSSQKSLHGILFAASITGTV